MTEEGHMQEAAADRLKAELLGSVSHELRNPLAVIKGYAATLLRHEHSLEQTERREFLEAIGVACDRLEVMVNQLLEMSQLETGMLVPRFMPVNLEQVVRESGIAIEDRLAKGEFGEHRLRLQVLGSDQLPLVKADPRLLRDAIDNVVENAVKYSPTDGTIAVTLQVAHIAGIVPVVGGPEPLGTPTPNAVVMSVHDNGIGIPDEHLERIFDRFHRVDAGLTREANGLGLGLAICKRIIELHGGAVWGESELGEGSTFFVAIPVAAAEEESPLGRESPSSR
ncbi:MAG: sensor histidine kinase [Ktedonobacterales bacterium]